MRQAIREHTVQDVFLQKHQGSFVMVPGAPRFVTRFCVLFKRTASPICSRPNSGQTQAASSERGIRSPNQGRRSFSTSDYRQGQREVALGARGTERGCAHYPQK